MLRGIGVFCISVSAIFMFACGIDASPPGLSQNDVTVPGNPEAPSASPDDTTSEPLGITSDAVITPAACSVTLNFCDRPNSSIGTDCTETGCSLSTAISACKSIVASVGCAVHCNAVMRDSSGTVIDTWRVMCGTTCCPEGNFCGAGGRCCDGTCKPGCPC